MKLKSLLMLDVNLVSLWKKGILGKDLRMEAKYVYVLEAAIFILLVKSCQNVLEEMYFETRIGEIE